MKWDYGKNKCILCKLNYFEGEKIDKRNYVYTHFPFQNWNYYMNSDIYSEKIVKSIACLFLINSSLENLNWNFEIAGFRYVIMNQHT